MYDWENFQLLPLSSTLKEHKTVKHSILKHHDIESLDNGIFNMTYNLTEFTTISAIVKIFSRTSMAGTPLKTMQILSETWVVQANECKSLRQVRMHNRDVFSTFFNMKV